MMIRLEFSEKQQCFHFEDINKNNFNSNGYICITPYIDMEKAHKFTEHVWNSFKTVNLEVVQSLFINYED